MVVFVKIFYAILYFDQIRYVGQRLRESGVAPGFLKISQIFYKFYKQTLYHISAAASYISLPSSPLYLYFCFFERAAQTIL